jgi:hypothetical protein
MKTKGTEIGKVGGNSPQGATLGDTSRSRVGGTIPSTDALPTMSDVLPYLRATPNAGVVSTQDSQTLPIFNPSAGNTDSGVGHSGDLGGAGG